MRVVIHAFPGCAFLRLQRRYALGLCSLFVFLLASCQQPTPQPPVAPTVLQEPRFLPLLPAARTLSPTTEPQRAFSTAEALRTSKQYAQARQAFSDLVQRYPTGPLAADALLALGHIALTLEQYEQAALAYSSLLERLPNAAQTSEAQLGLGIALYHKQNYAPSLTATRLYLTQTPAGPNQGLAQYYVGVAALKLQRYAEGIAALKATTGAGQDVAVTKQAQEVIASTVRDRLPVDVLKALAQQYAHEYPGNLVLERLAQEYRKTGNTAAEAQALQQMVRAFPQAPGHAEAQARLQQLRLQPSAEGTKIGVLLPLSGPGARVGTRALRGVELALAMQQEQEPGLKLVLAVRDSGQNADAAREALRLLVNSDQVSAVIGPLLSRTATELAPLAEQLRIPLISPYARDSDFPALSSYAFRNSLTDALQGRYLAEYALGTLKLQRFVILHPNDPYGLALRDRFRDQVLQHQGEVVAVIAYDAKNSNISPLLGQLKGLQYDAIFLPEYADKVGTIVRQMAAQGLTRVQLLGTDVWNAPALVARDARLLEGAVFVDGFFAQASAPLVQTFVERFRTHYQEEPDLLAAQAYDTLLLCAQALKMGAQTPEQFRDRLVRIRDFVGVSGLTNMGTNRDADKVPYLLTVKRGQIVQLNAGSATR